MKRLVDLLSKDFEIVAFSDKIMALPPEEWPVVDCMIAFYSDFFPFNDGGWVAEFARRAEENFSGKIMSSSAIYLNSHVEVVKICSEISFNISLQSKSVL